MRYVILGPVEFVANGRPVPVARPQRRALFALLLLHANRAISPAAAAEALWGPSAPKTARAQVHASVHALRKQLCDAGHGETIRWHVGGYMIEVGPDELDCARLARHIAEAKKLLARRRFGEVASIVRDGLRLWRGEPLGGAKGLFVPAAREHLHELRRTALEMLADAELAMGRHAEIVAEIAPAMDEYPQHERFCAQLMTALHLMGRTAEALARFRRLRTALSDEHGLDPSPALRELEEAILRGTLEPPRLDVGRAEEAADGSIIVDSSVGAALPAAPGPAVPAQLPPDVYGFSGRADELARLDALLAGAERHPTAVVISAVSGTAGVGKPNLEN